MITVLELLIWRLVTEMNSRIEGLVSLRTRRSEVGFTTAELLGNAALGVLALVAIWALMGGLAERIMAFIEQKMTSGQ